MLQGKSARTALLVVAMVLLSAGQAGAQGRGNCGSGQAATLRGASQLRGGAQQSALMTALQQQRQSTLLAALRQQQLVALQQQLAALQQQQLNALLVALQQQQLQNAQLVAALQQPQQPQLRAAGNGR
jgi:hypothetical protein